MKNILISRILPIAVTLVIPRMPYGDGDTPTITATPGSQDIPFTPDEIQTVKAEGPAEDVPADFSDIGNAIKEAVKPIEEKKVEEKKPEEKKTEEKKTEEKKVEKVEEKKTEEKKVEEKKTEEKKGEKKELPKDDKDLDSIQPKPGSTSKTENDFKILKLKVGEARTYAREVEQRLQATAQELETIKTSGVTAETAAKVKELEQQLKERDDILLTVQAEHHPKFTEEWNGKQEKADATLVGLLKQLGMPDKEADAMKEKGLDSFNDAFWEKNILSKLSTLNRQKVVNAIMGRDQVKSARAEKLSELHTNRDGFINEIKGKEQNELKEFANRSEKHSVKICGQEDWANKKDITDAMSAEEKAAATKHNTEVDGRIERVSKAIIKAWQRDPEATTDMAIQAEQAAIYKGQLDKITAEKTALEERVADLESRLTRKRKAGEIEPTPENTPITPKNETKIGQSASEAISAYWDKK